MEYSIASYQSTDARDRRAETLTVLEASRRAGVTQSAIVRWIRNGYLPATPSANGWQIPAGDLEQASQAADEARGTSPVPRATHPSLAPTPVPIRQNVLNRANEATQQDVGEHVVAPLAELIRDQIDVVHDQAEVIGWLQAERARLTAEVERLQTTGNASVINASQELPAESELYDEVLSLLWKDGTTVIEDEAPDVSFDGPENPEPPVEAMTSMDAPDVFDAVDPFAVEASDPDDQPLRLEDYADPSWFFGKRDIHADDDGQNDRPRASLQPIVPRGGSVSSAEDTQLDQMIDETERKIAELWRSQEELRRSPARQVVDPIDDQRQQRGNRWQRIWPRRR